MPLDIKYNASSAGIGPDNVLGSDNNYETTPGATSKAGRLIAAEYRPIDGVPFGNKAWKALERASDTTENRALLKRYLEECLAPLVASGEIRDLVVTVDDPTTLKGLGALVTFYDVKQRDTSTLGVLAPWGIT
jgi:hypothetical protein